MLLALAAAGLIYYYVKKQMRADPNRIRRAQRLGGNLRREVQAAIDEIAKRQLSPREEVIATYQVFLKVMDAAGHGRQTFLPPDHYCFSMNEVFPTLGKDFHRITDVFSETLYGERNVQPPALGEFRLSFKEVIRFFF